MTRAMVTVHTERGALCCIHVSGDGYPQGLGLELAEFLERFRLSQESATQGRARTSTQAGRLAAQLVAELASTAEGAYLCWPDQHFDVYSYRIEVPTVDSIRLSVTSPGSRVIFQGHPGEFLQRTVP